MPYVQIKMAHDPKAPLTIEQKKALVKGATELLVNVAGRNPTNILVEIIEGDPDNWGVGGQLVSERRKA